MSRYISRVAVAALALGTAPKLLADDPVTDRMKKDIFYLAGPECEGRGVKTEGIRKAGEYVAAAFRDAGLAPGGKGDSYFQPFDIAGMPKLGTPNTLTLTGPDGAALDLKYGTDFTPTGLSAPGKLSAGLAFAGYGITSDAPKYDDYAGLDVKGKWVVVVRQTPGAGAAKPAFDPKTSPHASLQSKLANAAKHGAAGVLFVNPVTEAKADPLMAFDYAAGESAGMPAAHLKRAVVDKLLAAGGKTLTEWEAAVAKDLKPQGVPLRDWAAAAEFTITRPPVPTRNVVGVAEGSGPLADETVVIGAHYDHLGFGEFASAGGQEAKGKVHYGADDNGSGTTGLIELARRFGAAKGRAGRRVVFVAFSGEELGLHGSQLYVKNPAFPLGKTVFMVNMDMIGRVAAVEDDAALVRLGVLTGGAAGSTLPDARVTRDRLVVYGTGTAAGLDALVDAVNAGPGFKLLKVPGGVGPSDHTSFYLKKIPVLFFFTGTHRDYHRPSDTPDKINLAGMKKALGMIEAIVTRLAAAPDRPGYLATKGGGDDPTDPNPVRMTRGGGPKLGIMPGNYQATDGGVLVDDVSPGGAAEKAGIKAGDVIVEIAGKPVKNIGGYMATMAGQKSGEPIEVTVLRQEKKVTVKAVPLP